MCIDDLHTSRRDFIRLAALFTASGALPFLNARPALAGDQAANTPVKIGYLPITDATPLLVAHHNKLFEAEGIQVECIHASPVGARIVTHVAATGSDCYKTSSRKRYDC